MSFFGTDTAMTDSSTTDASPTGPTPTGASSADPAQADPPPAGGSPTDPSAAIPPGGQGPKLVAVVAGLTAALAVMLLAFGLPPLHGGPHHVPLGVTGPSSGTLARQLRQLPGNGPEAWDLTTYWNAASLIHAIKNREVAGGLAIDHGDVTSYTATAGGPPTAAAIRDLGSNVSMYQDGSGRTIEVVPFPREDPKGAGLTAAALPMILGGILPAVALLALFPGHRGLRLRVTGAVLFALAGGAAMAAVMQSVFGTLGGSFWAVSLGLALGMAALALPLLGLESLLGSRGLFGGSALMMVVGNPLSGLSSGPYWLPDGWSTLGQLLPPGASGSLLRDNGFFGGATGGGPVAVLLCWAAAGLLLVLLADRRRAGKPAGREAV